MSKKSRKRNKKILAAIGIGLGAAALASRKKGTAADVDSGRGGDSSSAKSRVEANTPKKKDTVVKTPTTIQDNKPAKRSNASIAGDFITKVNNPKKMEYGMQMSNDLVSSKLPGRTRTPIKADNSGIIKQYKSGGRVKKSMGKALRGGGKVMR